MKEKRRGGKGGFVLLEVLLALALFGLVAVALTNGLSQVGQLAVEGQLELRVINGLQSAILEGSKVPELEEGVITSEPDSLGIVYETTVEEMELYSTETLEKESKLLENMWRIQVRAIWEINGRQEEEIAEVFRYEPLYQAQTGGGASSRR